MKAKTETEAYHKKIKKILEARKTLSLIKVGKKFGLSGERIRQIEKLKFRKRCKYHNRFYYGVCEHCEVEKYRTLISSFDDTEFFKEIKVHKRNKRRDYISVMKRVYLIEMLRDVYDKSANEIAEIMGKHKDTIIHLLETKCSPKNKAQ